MDKKSKKELQAAQLEKLVKEATGELKSDWCQLSASCKDNDERARWEKLLFPEPLTLQQKYEFCAVIRENVTLEKEGNTIINLAARWQAYQDVKYPLVGDIYITFSRVGADSNVTFILGEDEPCDMLIFMGSDTTGMNRGFVVSKEEGVDTLCEIDYLCLCALSKDASDSCILGIENYFWDVDYRQLDIWVSEDADSTKELIADNAKELVIKASMTAAEYEAYFEREAEARRVKFVAEYKAKFGIEPPNELHSPATSIVITLTPAPSLIPMFKSVNSFKIGT